MSILHTYTAEDLKRLKKELEAFPQEASARSVAIAIAPHWSCPQDTLIKWVRMARYFTDETIDLLEAGKIKKSFLTVIRDMEFGHPSYRDMVARASAEYDISVDDLPFIKSMTMKGRHPIEAVKMAVARKGGKKPFTKSEVLSVDHIIKELEKNGFAWRQRAVLLKSMGTFQVVKDGVLNNRLAYTIAAMKTAVDDMKRFVDEMWEGVPKDIQEAVSNAFVETPQEEGDRQFCDDLLALPSPEPMEEGSGREAVDQAPDESPEVDPPVGETEAAHPS